MTNELDGHGFTPGDTAFVADLDAKMEKQRVTERNFWIMWEELTPVAKESIIDTARQWVSDGTTGLPNSDMNIEFYTRLVKQWDSGDLDKE